MSKTVTINAPYSDGTLKKITGKIAYFKIGEKRVKFLIQDSEHGNEKFLTHYASGNKLKSLTPIKIRYARSYKTLTDRSAAELTLQEIIGKFGIDRFFAVLNAAETINN